ncbi:hypothetical protein ACJX0J_030060, partial [Zea mays]
ILNLQLHKYGGDMMQVCIIIIHAKSEKQQEYIFVRYISNFWKKNNNMVTPLCEIILTETFPVIEFTRILAVGTCHIFRMHFSYLEHVLVPNNLSSYLHHYRYNATSQS